MSRHQVCLFTHLAFSACVALPLAILMLSAVSGIGPYRWLVEAELAFDPGMCRPMTTLAFMGAILAVGCYYLFEARIPAP